MKESFNLRVDESKKVIFESPRAFQQDTSGWWVIRDVDLFNKSKEALEKVPIPTPWFRQTYPGFESNKKRKLTWRPDIKQFFFSQLQESRSNSLSLLDNRLRKYMTLGTGKYPYQVGQKELLLVYNGKDSTYLYLFNIEDMNPVSLLQEIRWNGKEILHNSKIKARIEIPASTKPGELNFEFPKEMKGLPEIFYIINLTKDRNSSPTYALYQINPSKNLVKISPLEWFNEGKFDYDYVWIRRVARLDEKTLVGEGMRLGIFTMDNEAKFIKYVVPQYIFT